MEWSSDGLGSDFTYSRYGVEGRGYLPLTQGMTLKGRLGLGTTSVGSLPFQKHFTVGGISTIPAVNYKQSRGDHYILGNFEYGVLVWQGEQRVGIKTNVQLLAVLDVGQAWFGDSYDLNGQHMLIDAGIGVALADERVKLYVLQDLNNSKLDPLWTIRFSSPF
jgi:outer membrane protein assembly factor BamA